MSLGARMRMSVPAPPAPNNSSVEWTELSQPLGADESFQTNPYPFNDPAYSSIVGTNPSAIADLITNVPMTLYYEVSNNATTWTLADTITTGSTNGRQEAHAVEVYNGYTYARFRLVNGSSPASDTLLKVGLRHA